MLYVGATIYTESSIGMGSIHLWISFFGGLFIGVVLCETIRKMKRFFDFDLPERSQVHPTILEDKVKGLISNIKLKLYFKEHARFVVFFVILTVFVWVLFSQTLTLVHNTPANTHGGLSEIGSGSVNQSTADLHNISNNQTRFGLTYGDPGEPVPVQTEYGIGIISIFPRVLKGALFYVGTSLIFFRLIELYTEKRRNKFMLQLLSYVSLYMLSLIGYFHEDKKIVYYTSNAIELGIVEAGIIKPFYLLIFVESIIVGGLTAIWTQPLIPVEKEAEIIRFHRENWKQYGTWGTSLLGGVFLSSAVVFITDVSDVGWSFLRIAITLFGGGLVMYIAFIIYKIQNLEEEFEKQYLDD